MNHMNRREWLCGAAAGLITGVPAEAAEAAAALRADLPTLQRAYSLLHPGLYRYQTPEAFAAKIDALDGRLRHPCSLDDQYLALARLTASIRCGHTYGNFYNQSKFAQNTLFEGLNRLPFFFVWLGSRLVVTHNPMQVEGLQRGSEVLAIDGVSVAEIQARLLPYIRADGGNDAKRRKLLDVQGIDSFETFDVFYNLLYPMMSSSFTLKVKSRPNADARLIKVVAFDRQARLKASPQTNDITSAGYWSLDFPAPGVAVMTMPGWALYDAKWDWHARLDDMFETVAERDTAGLVIDLRENEGGQDCGYDILARLIDQPMPVTNTYDRLVRYRSTPQDLRPFLDTWDHSFDTLGEQATDVGNGFFALPSDADDKRGIEPKGPRFKGRVAILSSAQNSSATFQFIDLMQRNGLARVYGETTGGNQRGINGGCFFFLRLRNSGLETDLPLIGQFPKTPKPDAGLAPDVFIAPSIEDIASGRDAVLERAVADLRA